ncbi:MAG: AMP-binding protein [Aquamicrobium sp.]|uniref:AMP-binding protein n=1 Tax=Aquamicrobium sp. TaxID=1872579 RepID=UPI00349EA852|nr:AMP-binding protein [Aquamicrobium sp.]MCO5155525.1 AMP-binding protein [Aquamicrobium sp.]
MRQEPHLAPRPANHVPLTPVEFLVRAVEVHGDRPAVAWGEESWTYRSFARMVDRLARFLAAAGVRKGDVVSVMAANRPETLAAHYAVPMLGAVLNTINTRLDAAAVGYILRHCESRLLLCDPDCLATASPALPQGTACHVLAGRPGEVPASDALDILADDGIEPALDLDPITDEWQPICVNYTSGTTGHPKGVVYTHRGAYLNALGNVLALGLTERSTYLWTLPMFHCNGWCHTWAVTAAGGLHVCLDRPDPALIFPALEARGVTHLSCAPVVLYMLLNHPARHMRNPANRVKVATGGAAPTEALIEQLGALGFDLTHLYGLTESYGPATLRDLDGDERARPAAEVAHALARQGMRHATASRATVVDEAGEAVPMDGSTMGEIVLRGNTLMAGYYRDAEATAQAFRGGVFHTGDLAVRHPDGNIEIRDRSKDIIISGGENISSLEIEGVLHRHPAVLLAAVVAMPHDKWGETPAAFVELREAMTADEAELRAFCRRHLAGYKVPSRFFFSELPKTATGKIQKFALRDLARSAGPETR